MIEAAIERYQDWIADLQRVKGQSTSEIVGKMVELLNQYRNYLDIDVIFDSDEDFLYRQRGQTKLDNSVIEEFLPHLIDRCVLKDIDDESLQLGPMRAFSAIYFTSTLDAPQVEGGLHVRTKNQDFAIARRVFLKVSYTSDFDQAETHDLCIAYVATECKTNLDKTMFQEASATANDVKSSVQGAKYFLLCEWLDMAPQSTAATDIDEVLILRRSKRIPPNIRSGFDKSEGRRQNRQAYVDFLESAPFAADVFERFVRHVASLISVEDPVEEDVLTKGYF